MISLLLQLPGLPDALPGLPVGYVPTAGAEMAWQAHDTLVVVSRYLFLLFLACALFFAFLAPAAKHRAAAGQALKSLFIVCVLFQAHVAIYGYTMAIGHEMSLLIVSEEQQEQFDRDWELAGDAEALEGMTPDELSGSPWYVRWALALSHATPTNVIAMAVLTSYSTAAFLLALTFVSMLWRALVMITFVMGPISVVFGLFPGWGSRVTITWFILVAQFSLWQVWIALCTLFVNKAEAVLSLTTPLQASIATINGSEVAIPNSYEAILIMLVSVFLALGVPVMVAVFFPYSRASQLMAWGVVDGAKTMVGTTMSVAEAPAKAKRIAGGFK